MGAALDKVVAHFGGLEVAAIDVPEWDMTIYVKPMTLKEQQALLRKTKDGDDATASVETLIMLAKDENGEPLFTLEDKPKLMRAASPDVVGRVAGEILTAHRIEEAEKN